MRNDVETGQSLSYALAKHERVFPPLMINMCRAGEVGGFLDAVLLQVAENYEAEVKLRSKIKSAMTYPVVVFCFAIIAVIGMLLFIVPVFAAMFDGLGGELPAPTKVLVVLSEAMKFIAPIGIVAAIVDRGAVGPLQARRPGAQGDGPHHVEAAGVREPVPEGGPEPVRAEPRAPCCAPASRSCSRSRSSARPPATW